MSTQLKYNKQIKAKDIVILSNNKALKSNIKSLWIDNDNKTYLTNQLKTKDFAFVIDKGCVVGIGKFLDLKQPENKEKLRQLGHQLFEQHNKSASALQIEGENAEAIALVMEGLALSSYQFIKYFKDKKERTSTLKYAYTTNKNVEINKINTIAEATNWAKELVNEPLSYLTAEQLAKDVKTKCEPVGINVEILGKSKIKALKMGGLLAVNKGSIDPPTFTILEWKPKKPSNKKPIVLVGKGVVYDTGGLSLKPTANSMDFMKSDMGGAAAMAATIYAMAKLKSNLHIIALLPATDNRPSGNAYAPGDVITMMDGTTVEVLNTDAEGRMILADALAYAKKFDPELVIDAATLTGAAVAAIGTSASVAMGNANAKELKALEKAGFNTWDRVALFPFWADYKDLLKSSIADLKNLGGPYAGTITAGKFLEHFTDYPYIHIDIAGPAFTHKKEGYRGQGGTGAGVRLLIDFLSQKAK
ncbi:MAG: leucyl aminopeptidase family protein [Putridiphycobacter sp.]